MSRHLPLDGVSVQATDQAGWGPLDEAWFRWGEMFHADVRPFPEAWSAWFYDQDGRHVILYRSVESMLAGDDVPICGAKAMQSMWICPLPPDHETRHLPASEQLVAQGFRVSHIASTTQPISL